MLIEVKTADESSIRRTFNESFINFALHSLDDFKQVPQQMDLIIIGCRLGDDLQFKNNINKLQHLFSLSQLLFPPLLALFNVNELSSKYFDREKLFASGMTDYCLTPILKYEVIVRIQNLLAVFSKQMEYLQSVTIKTPMMAAPDLLLADKASKYLLNHLDKPLSLQAVVEKMATNRNKLTKAFKRYYGTTPMNWFKQQKMIYAAEKLTKSYLSIVEIAYATGFKDSNYFSSTFKNVYQMSPSKYRKMNQEKM